MITLACSQWPEAVSWSVLAIAVAIGYVAYRMTGGDR